jgi:hypothetical protein
MIFMKTVNNTFLKGICLLMTIASAIVCEAQNVKSNATAKSVWAYGDNNGKLAYKATKKGDRIMDFRMRVMAAAAWPFPSLP